MLANLEQLTAGQVQELTALLSKSKVESRKSKVREHGRKRKANVERRKI
jgi:hypothetical protein